MAPTSLNQYTRSCDFNAEKINRGKIDGGIEMMFISGHDTDVGKTNGYNTGIFLQRYFARKRLFTQITRKACTDCCEGFPGYFRMLTQNNSEIDNVAQIILRGKTQCPSYFINRSMLSSLWFPEIGDAAS